MTVNEFFKIVEIDYNINIIVVNEDDDNLGSGLSQRETSYLYGDDEVVSFYVSNSYKGPYVYLTIKEDTRKDYDPDFILGDWRYEDRLKALEDEDED